MQEVTDGFVKDEKGKIFTLPLKMDWINPDSLEKKGCNSANKNSVRRKFIPIERLVLTPADFEEHFQNEAKRRKIDRPIRKELFKVPQKKPDKWLSSYSGRRQSTSKNFISSNIKATSQRKEISKKKIQAINDGSPLLDVDEAEILLRQKTLLHNPLKTILFPINTIKEECETTVKNNEDSPTKTSLINNPKTPPSTESIHEFLQFEKNLTSAKKVNKKNETASPMSSMCTLLENTKINNSGAKHKNKDSVLEEIASLLKHDEQQFQLLKQQFECYQQQREISVNKIKDLIKQTSEDKENKTRRSNRIAAQANIKTKLIISPVISKSVDLRKSTLNKNLSKNLQYESPRMRNAMNMYNTFRNDCSILCTPKLDRTNVDLPQASATRSLSRRIQKQCLLLQDTPKHS